MLLALRNSTMSFCVRMKSCRSAAAGVAQISSPNSQPRALPIGRRPDHRDFAVAARSDELAIGQNRRSKVRVHGSFEHLSHPTGIQGRQDAAFTQHEQHIVVEQRRRNVGHSFLDRHSTCDFVTSPRPPSLTAYRPFLVLLRARRYFQSRRIQDPSLFRS